jgi:hypothetical protein
MKVLLITTNAFKMSSNAITTQNNIDEFGRDLSLKPEKQVTSIFGKALDRFKGMSWAEICYLVEDEEEEEMQREQEEMQREQDKVKQAEREELRKVLAERKQLYEQGLYELEEGEELDM